MLDLSLRKETEWLWFGNMKETHKRLLKPSEMFYARFKGSYNIIMHTVGRQRRKKVHSSLEYQGSQDSAS